MVRVIFGIVLIVELQFCVLIVLHLVDNMQFCADAVRTNNIHIIRVIGMVIIYPTDHVDVDVSHGAIEGKQRKFSVI